MLYIYYLVPVGLSTSVTFFPSAYTAYPVTMGEGGEALGGCQVTRRVPSCGPGSTWMSTGGWGKPKDDIWIVYASQMLLAM